MDPGLRTPLVDFFRRGEVAGDIKLLAAQGALAPRAGEQLAILLILLDDEDPQIASTALATLDGLPTRGVADFLARSDTPSEMRAFFAARGIEPSDTPAPDSQGPVIDRSDPIDDLTELVDVDETGDAQKRPIHTLTVMERMKLAMRGTREQRAVLIRDPNKIVGVAVLSSPKLTESEVESFARMGNVSEEVLRMIGTGRAWIKHYGVAAGLIRNPKTPPAISMPLVSRLNERDLKLLATDRNVPEALRITARKILTTSQARRH
jgi:hypothetical protein